MYWEFSPAMELVCRRHGIQESQLTYQEDESCDSVTYLFVSNDTTGLIKLHNLFGLVIPIKLKNFHGISMLESVFSVKILIMFWNRT